MRDWLRRSREEKGLTIAEMAQKLDISLSYYSLVESGKRQKKMDITLLTRISSVLDLPLADAVSLEAAKI